jgi:hypothetical protein
MTPWGMIITPAADRKIRNISESTQRREELAGKGPGWFRYTAGRKGVLESTYNDWLRKRANLQPAE